MALSPSGSSGDGGEVRAPVSATRQPFGAWALKKLVSTTALPVAGAAARLLGRRRSPRRRRARPTGALPAELASPPAAGGRRLSRASAARAVRPRRPRAPVSRAHVSPLWSIGRLMIGARARGRTDGPLHLRRTAGVRCPHGGVGRGEWRGERRRAWPSASTARSASSTWWCPPGPPPPTSPASTPSSPAWRSIPLLHTRLGRPAAARGGRSSDAGVGTGDLLVATTAAHRPGRGRPPPAAGARAGRPPGCALGALVLRRRRRRRGWPAGSRAHTGSATPARPGAVALLVVAAVAGVLPVGRLRRRTAWSPPRCSRPPRRSRSPGTPHPARLPTVLGVTALVAAVAAAVARALDRRNEEALRVWITVGVGLFLVTGAGRAAAALAPQVAWGAAARGRAAGRPGSCPASRSTSRTSTSSTSNGSPSPPGPRATGRRAPRPLVVPRAAVADVAARGHPDRHGRPASRSVVAAVSAPLLLATADPAGRPGRRARAWSFFCGCGLLLAGPQLPARGRPGAAARGRPRLLGRAGGRPAARSTAVRRRRRARRRRSRSRSLRCWWSSRSRRGRGWRSAWWSRRAEVAEGLCGSARRGLRLVATGVFRNLWESMHLQV